MTQEGKPLRKRRYMFSETFAIIDYALNAVANKEQKKLERAVEIFRDVVRRYRCPDETTPPKTNSQTRDMKSNSMPMILLATAKSLRTACSFFGYDDGIAAECNQLIADSAGDVRNHFYKQILGLLLENVMADGSLIDTPEGRVVNPCHAIETSWLLLEEAREQKDDAMKNLALNILRDSLTVGWDKEYGGIL